MFNLTLSFSLVLSNATAADSPAMSFLLTIRLPLSGLIGPLPINSHFLGDTLFRLRERILDKLMAGLATYVQRENRTTKP